MEYIINNLELIKDNEIKKLDIIVKNNKIDYLKKDIFQKRKIVGDYSDFYMVPTYSTVIDDICECGSFQEKKELYKQLIYKGYTSFVYPIKYHQNLDSVIIHTKQELLNCPIDYFFALKIELEDLTENIIRLCKKYQFCGIFVIIRSIDQIKNVPWGWIRQAYFNYYAPLVPIFPIGDNKQTHEYKKTWNKYVSSIGIETLDEIRLGHILTKQQLCSFGIYPNYANIHQGIPLAYHLIFRESYYGGSILPNEIVYTSFKGHDMRIFDKINLYPGLGENINLKVQSYFRQLN